MITVKTPRTTTHVINKLFLSTQVPKQGLNSILNGLASPWAFNHSNVYKTIVWCNDAVKDQPKSNTNQACTSQKKTPSWQAANPSNHASEKSQQTLGQSMSKWFKINVHACFSHALPHSCIWATILIHVFTCRDNPFFSPVVWSLNVAWSR